MGLSARMWHGRKRGSIGIDRVANGADSRRSGDPGKPENENHWLWIEKRGTHSILVFAVSSFVIRENILGAWFWLVIFAFCHRFPSSNNGQPLNPESYKKL